MDTHLIRFLTLNFKTFLRFDKKPNYTKKRNWNKAKAYFFYKFIAVMYSFWSSFFSIKYVEKEGFNPSDDGVILAQSFRLINGEIPHKDFISLSPVFSGIIHMIHFYSPIPLEISSRWFTILEFFVYSFLWVYILFKIFNLHIWNKRRYIILSMSAGTFAFFLNVNNYILFPVTTIDALFLSTIGFTFYINKFNETFLYKKIFYIVIGLFFVSLAALCNQIFAIPAMPMFIYTIIKGIKNNKIPTTLLLLIIGSSPLWIYLFYLFNNEALRICLLQITNKSNLIQTGIIHFTNSFFTTKLFILNLITILLFFYIYIKNKSWLYNNNIPVKLSNARLKFTSGILLFYGLAAICFSFYHFMNGKNDIFTCLMSCFGFY